MLYLTRKIGETIIINKDIYITIHEIKSNKSVKLGFQFPENVTILRKEIHEKISSENFVASNVDIDIMKEIIKGQTNDDN